MSGLSVKSPSDLGMSIPSTLGQIGEKCLLNLGSTYDLEGGSGKTKNIACHPVLQGSSHLLLHSLTYRTH